MLDLLDPKHSIDLDHCLYSGKFLGRAHEKCNLTKRNINFIAVRGCNIQNYDPHHNCSALNNCESTATTSVLPATDKKYISMNSAALIDAFVNVKGTTVKVHEYLRFIDSFKMMTSSLEKLLELHPGNQFKKMKMFPTVSSEYIQLLKQKCYYLYVYVSSPAKFSDTHLPPLEKWGKTLDGGQVNITK